MESYIQSYKAVIQSTDKKKWSVVLKRVKVPKVISLGQGQIFKNIFFKSFLTKHLQKSSLKWVGHLYVFWNLTPSLLKCTCIEQLNCADVAVVTPAIKSASETQLHSKLKLHESIYSQSHSHSYQSRKRQKSPSSIKLRAPLPLH